MTWHGEFMRAYLIVTGAVFGMIVLAHIWRAVAEGLHAARSPWFILSTVLAATLAAWAVRLLIGSARRNG
jgi:hypothetical protein